MPRSDDKRLFNTTTGDDMNAKIAVISAITIAATGSWAQELNLDTSVGSTADAVVAASLSHDVLYEDENIRLLSVTIPPGGSAPMHHHALPSVLIIDSYAKATEQLAGGIRIASEQLPGEAQVPFVMVRGPQAAHAVTNTDTMPFHLYRLEFKNLDFQNVRRALDQRQDQIQ